MKLILFSFIFLVFAYAYAVHHHHRSSFLAPKKTLPKLSSVVLDPNPHGLTEFNSFLISLSPYNLTQGETRAFFRLCDRDRDDRISAEEWENCVNLFVNPYESTCLSSKNDYLLKASDLKKCLTLDVFDVVPTETTTKEKPEDVLLHALNREDEKKANFMDYVFLRRASFAWRECSVDNRLNKRRMECALSATTPQKRKFLPVSNQVFNIGIQLYKTKVKENEAFLDYYSFVKIAYIYYYFNEFELPFQEEYLSKKALIRGIEDQILPTSVNVELAHKIFYALDPDNHGNKLRIDFAGYASLNHLLRVYKKQAQKSKKKLNFTQGSFDKMVKESEWDHFNNVLLANARVIEEKDYKKLTETVSKGHSHKSADGEREYFTRLIQKEKEGANKNQLIYKIFDDEMKNSWNYTTLVSFAKLTWAYQAIDLDDDGLVSSDDINLYLRSQQPLIPFTPHEMKNFETATDTMRTDQINIKEFFSFFTYERTFLNVLIPNSGHAVTWTNLKRCMSNLGLRITNETKKYSKEFFALSKLPSYNYEKAFKRGMKEEILLNKIAKLASEDKQFLKNEDEVKKNVQNYRKYFESEIKNDNNWR